MTDITKEDVIAAAELAAEGPAETKFQLHAFTNDKTNPIIIKQLEMFYQATLASRIGIMHAKNVETDKIETLLVGVDITPEGPITYPLAKILGEEDLNRYLPPDGNGGYLTDAVSEVTEH